MRADHIQSPAISYVCERMDPAEIGIILGSGLGPLADAVSNPVVMPTEAIPGYPKSTVSGHAGKMIHGTLSGRRVIILSGRTHMYEGYRPADVRMGVGLMHALGIQTLIVTNAAGGIHPEFTPGDLMLIKDHLNLTFRQPLEDLNPKPGQFRTLYDPGCIEITHRTALSCGFNMQEGTYCGLLGPNYETAAEIRMLRRLGADAVGMSTIPDVLMARYLNIQTLGISCITNYGTGLSNQTLSHAEVTIVANRIQDQFIRLITELLPRIEA